MKCKHWKPTGILNELHKPTYRNAIDNLKKIVEWLCYPTVTNFLFESVCKVVPAHTMKVNVGVDIHPPSLLTLVPGGTELSDA